MLYKVICFAGIHQWSEWKYQRLLLPWALQCTQERACKRCVRVQTRQDGRHSWNNFEYQFPESCTQISTCSRCLIQKELLLHQWSEWKRTDSGCQRTCEKCVQKEHSAHQWVVTDSGIREEEVGFEHIYKTSYVSYKCKRCGENKFEGQSQKYRITWY
jgi:hypothetical protein